MLLDSRRIGSLRFLFYGVMVVVAIFLIAPIVFLALLSLGSSPWLVFPPPHWTLKWYAEFFADPSWLAAIGTSFKIAILTAILATLLAIPASFGMVRGKFPGRKFLNAYFMLPMIVPVIVVAIAIYAIFLKIGLTGTLPGFVLSHTVLALPFSIICISTALRGFETDIERAAVICGVNPWRAKVTITLRNLLVGVMSGFLFAFLISWDEVVVALFMSTPALETLPIKMWSTLRLELSPMVAVAGVLLALVSIIAMGGIALVLRSARKTTRSMS